MPVIYEIMSANTLTSLGIQRYILLLQHFVQADCCIVKGSRQGTLLTAQLTLACQVLFTDRCRWQNFCPSLLCFVNNCVESIDARCKIVGTILWAAVYKSFYDNL